MICSLNIPRSFTLAVASQLEALGTATFQDGGGTGQVGFAGGAHDEKMPNVFVEMYILYVYNVSLYIYIYVFHVGLIVS